MIFVLSVVFISAAAAAVAIAANRIEEKKTGSLYFDMKYVGFFFSNK